MARRKIHYQVCFHLSCEAEIADQLCCFKSGQLSSYQSSEILQSPKVSLVFLGVAAARGFRGEISSEIAVRGCLDWLCTVRKLNSDRLIVVC